MHFEGSDVKPRRVKGRREAALEARCVKWARFQGAIVAKLTELVGVPDRVFFVPGGRPLIVEFKARDESPEAIQNWYLLELERLGYRVITCDSWEKFLELWKSN